MRDELADATGAGAAEWLSYHIFYHGQHDLLLARLVLDSLRGLWRERLIRRFFFIRYGLGGPHVRLRLLCVPADRPAVDTLLRERASAFFAVCPSVESLDEEAIRAMNQHLSRSDPTAADTVYPDNSVVELSFDPELERYGGPELIDHSLRFFSLSSAFALDFVERHANERKTRRSALALRALLRQALGFAAGGPGEMLRLLAYAPQGEGEREAPWTVGADREFEQRREVYARLVEEEVQNLLGWEGDCPLELALAEGSRLLSALIADAAAAARWRIATSQLHMTANRLGLLPWEEAYLGRLLWRAVREVQDSQPLTFHLLGESLAERRPVDRNGLTPLVAACCEEILNP